MGQEGEDIVADETGGLPLCSEVAAGACCFFDAPCGPEPKMAQEGEDIVADETGECVVVS